MKKFLPLLLCLSLSVFAATRPTKAACPPARNARSAQNNASGQNADPKPLFTDENNDQDVVSEDDDSMAGASDNEGENVNDDNGSDAAGDEDAGGNAAGDDDDGGGDEGE
ncbi:MAG TPA: hypothetical protein VGK91_08665 [Candidatus Udaeobacter sp.]